jgi:hypothetical protein
LTKRIDLRAAIKKHYWKFNLAGGFDSFRERCGLNIFMMRWWNYFYEKAIRYGAKPRKWKLVAGGKKVSDVQIAEPVYHLVRTGALWKTGQRERGVVGIYIRTSIRWLQIWDEVLL